MDAAGGERGPVWFVQAAGKVWGPYPQGRIEEFVSEGRVAAETLIAPAAEGPFLPAARQARLHRLFGDVEPDLVGPAGQEERQDQLAMMEGGGEARALAVWAGLKSQRPERFEQALAVHGPFVAVGPGLWVVRARMGPSALRNALSRRLDSSDRLMVLEATLAQAAWFNIEGEADRTLRQLWGAPAERREV